MLCAQNIQSCGKIFKMKNLIKIKYILKNNISLSLSSIFLLIIFSYGNLSNILSKDCCDDINNLGNFEHPFYFKPFITEYLVFFLNEFLSTKSFLIISLYFIPIIIHVFLFKIFSRYLPSIWSISLCFVSLISYQNINFRDFLIGFDLQSINLDMKLLAIQKFPLPSISVLFFLIIFYYSIDLKKLSLKRISFFTFLWSSYFYINALDAIFGIVFWYTYFLIRTLLIEKQIKQIRNFLIQIFISFIILLPAFVYSNTSNIGNAGLIEFKIFEYQLIYMLLPLFLIIITYYLYKIDLRELLFKFLPVYLLMFIEFSLIYLSYFFNFGVNIDILKNRIPLFFLHFYYYLPIIYFISNSYASHENRFFKDFRSKLGYILSQLFNKISKFVLPIIWVFLFVFVYKINTL